MAVQYKNSLLELKQRWANSDNEVTRQHIFCRGGRTGRKVHIALAGSSTLECGHWLKTVAARFAVSVAQADKMERCEKCFGTHFLEK